MGRVEGVYLRPEQRKVSIFLSLGLFAVCLPCSSSLSDGVFSQKELKVGLGGCRKEAERWQQKC